MYIDVEQRGRNPNLEKFALPDAQLPAGTSVLPPSPF